MEYKKIISVTGFSGLFEVIGKKTDGAIVRSLEDKQTKFISSRLHEFSQLEGIEIYTTQENVNMVEFFKLMKASNEKLPAEKDPAALKSYFQKIYPTIDLARVYVSDMKKMVRWFQLLQANQVEFILEETEPEEQAVETASVKEHKENTVVEKPKKTAAKKPNIANKQVSEIKEKTTPPTTTRTRRPNSK